MILLSGVIIGGPEGSLTAHSQVLERGISGLAEDPPGERNVPGLVSLDRGHEAAEDVLGDVLSFAAVVNDARDVPADIVGEAHVQEVERA
jgi:hypothetical protein